MSTIPQSDKGSKKNGSRNYVGLLANDRTEQIRTNTHTHSLTHTHTHTHTHTLTHAHTRTHTLTHYFLFLIEYLSRRTECVCVKNKSIKKQNQPVLVFLPKTYEVSEWERERQREGAYYS